MLEPNGKVDPENAVKVKIYAEMLLTGGNKIVNAAKYIAYFLLIHSSRGGDLSTEISFFCRLFRALKPSR